VVALESRLPWLSIAPFGSPVVPLVNTISARLSRVTAFGESGSARRASSGRLSTQTIGSPSWLAEASVWRLAMTSLASVWATIFCPKSTVWRTSSGTATAPRCWIAKNAIPHSGRLTDQTITRSPGPMPASARTRAARGTIAPRSR
jgi:hypothetical protein